MSSALAVWAAGQRSGLLDHAPDQHHYVFAYSQDALTRASQVSLTMPVRLESWSSRDLHPIFQMNLPEGALLDVIRRSIAKVADNDDLTILRVTGGNQVGRNRFSLPDELAPGIIESSESLDDLLTYPDTEELFHELVSKYALRSGVSGVQPKVLLDASDRGTATLGGYIVKSWGAEYPQLAANEFFCMTAVHKAGLPVPEFHLSDTGGFFVMKRFDVADDGTALGFEDVCALQARTTAQKYSSTYERVAKSITDFVSGENLHSAREQFFATLVLSCMMRNGDAHLKNFGVLYEQPGASVCLAPVYDVVTTTAYLARDVPALSLAGTKKWWPRSMLEKFAVAHLALPVAKVGQIFDKAAEAVFCTRGMIVEYMKEHPEFCDVGTRMLASWNEGAESLAKKV